VCVCVCACVCAYRVPGLGSCISGTFVFTLTTQVLRTHTSVSEALCLDVKISHPRASINSQLLKRYINSTTGSEFRIFMLPCGRPKSGMSTYGVRSTSKPACQHYVGSTGIPPCQYMVLGVPANRYVNIMLGVLAYRHVNKWFREYQQTGILT
jgi:hypothetical protein